MPKRFSNYFKKSFSSVVWVLKLFWKINPFYSSISLTTNVIAELLSILNAYIFARGIDILLKTSAGELEFKWLYLVAALFFAMSIASNINNLLMNYSQRILSQLFYPKYQQLMYKKLAKMKIGDLEDPETNNLIERSRRDSGRVERQFYEVNSFVGISSALIASGVIVFNFAPYFIPLFVIGLLPSLFMDRKFLTSLWNYNRNASEDRRKAYDSAHVLQESRNLQEIRVTGGVKLISDKFETFVERWVNGYKKIRKNWYQTSFFLRIVRGLIEAYADIIIFSRFVAGKISIGDVTFYIRQTSNFMGSLNSLANSMNNIYEGSLTISEIQRLFEKPEEVEGKIKMDRLNNGPKIKFEDVTFKYPGATKHVIESLNLEIKSGEKLAIVGHNGAGKTTLVKLLLKFYDVETGNIKINGNNLADLKINDYYKNVSALFQEFNAYAFLTVKENIFIGNSRKKLSLKKLKKAAKYADIDDFVKDYDNKYDQLLSEKYKGGIRPSTGQWQKIAIARFFYRNSPLVIFDEPTAAIDAEAEAKIFNKIYKFFKNKTVIIISHRFSTVRNADRIIVFDKGKILEQGSHKELMELKGKYAKAFNIQAKGYK